MDKLKRAALILLALTLSLCIQPAIRAQGNHVTVQLAGVQDDTFPQLIAYVRVVDQQGVPVPALIEDSFRISERDQAATVPDAVTGDTTRPMALVLALDLSLSSDDWQAVQAAVESLLATCSNRDRVALVTFSDQAETAAVYSSPDEALQAVRDLQVRGDYTDLHNAVLLATRLASESPLARSAVLVLTDSWDNRGLQTLPDTLSQIEDGPVPVHMIGLGIKMSQTESQQLVSIAQATGGLAYRLTESSRLNEQLDGLLLMLRHEYKVVFHSALPANDQPHSFRLNVTASGTQGEVEGVFTARSRELGVVISGLLEGQRVSGLLPLATQVEAPVGPVTEVEYWLDSRLLHTSAEAPFQFTWDSGSVAPGAYMLTAKARDAAGNTGAVKLRLEAVVPIVIVDVKLPSEVEVGEQVLIEAEVQSEAALDAVAVLLDGRSVGNAESGDAPGRYRLAFSSSTWGDGEHLIAVRARDVLGRSAEETRPVRFALPPTSVPAPTPTPVPVGAPDRAGLRDTIAIAAAGASVIAAGLLTAVIARGQRRRQRRVLPVEIQNQGNTRSRYDLRADDPAQALVFEWQCNGAPLARRQVVEQTDLEPPSREPKRPAPASEAGTLQQVQERTSAAMRSSGAIVSLLNTIASLLPRSAQGPLRSISRQIGRGRSTVGQARMASSRASRLAPSTRPRKRRASRPRPPAAVSPWSQTPFVEPGEAVTVELLVDPVRPYLAQQRTFRVLSRSTAQEDAPMTVDEQYLLITGVPWFRRWAPFALLYAAAAAVSLVVFWLVSVSAPGA